MRAGRNEVVFREVNERLRELGEGFSLVSEVAEFVCECGDSGCAERIELNLAEYERVRSDPTWFVIVPGHEVLDRRGLVPAGPERPHRPVEDHVAVELLGPAHASSTTSS